MSAPANFITRAQWGSDFNYGSNTRMPTTCKGVALHWEGPKVGSFTHDKCAGKVRGIEDFHTHGRGWAGIAYNALVCPHGYIFEGRGTRYRSAANGDVPKNSAYFAVCYLGGKGDPFTDLAKGAYIRAVQWLRADGGAGRAVIGHRDVTSTECPGDVIETWLKRTNFDAGTTTPEPKPQTAVWDLPSTWTIGSTGDAVTKLGQRLVVWAKHYGLPAPYKVGPGPEFTEVDRAAVAAFQRAQGWADEDADGYPGPETFRRLSASPAVTSPPVDEGELVETISANLGGYDKVKGLKNRVARARTVIPDYLKPKQPDWFHFQECAIDMFPELDERLPEYKRVGAGGKGRESYYHRGAGIKILEAQLLDVNHKLLKDTKEHLVIAYTKNGVGAVDVNFHNENEGSTFQPLQLRDVMNSARQMADKHDIDRANILVTGDANFKLAAAFARGQGWTEAIYTAAKKIDLGYVSTNAWLSRLVGGRRIDVDVVQRDAVVLEAEQLFGAVISDHWPHRVLRRLTTKK